MYNPVLSVPARRVSGWVAETDPKYARAWLNALPLANSSEAARELYHALYTLNRIDLRVSVRLDLMALYEPAIRTVVNGLQLHLVHVAPPLPAQKRQLAEFVRRLHTEMAFGYKCALRDLSRARLLLGKWQKFRHGIERVMYHLQEVLCRSYMVYISYPTGVWREVHELYRLAESLSMVDEASDDVGNEPTIAERYVQTLLLGLANPYQLPHNGALQIRGFLARWGELGRIAPISNSAGQEGQFVVDLTKDAPPSPLHWEARWSEETERLLEVQELLRVLRQFIRRAESGRTIDSADLGFDNVDTHSLDLLQRMARAWSEGAKRRHNRQARTNTNVSICSGIGALHFFSNGQRPLIDAVELELALAPPVDEIKTDEHAPDVAFVELDELDDNLAGVRVPLPVDPMAREIYRVDRWQLKDVSPQGMSLVCESQPVLPLRVGDLLGVQQSQERWSPAVVRWLKSPRAETLEAGIELLAGGVTAIAVRTLTGAAAKPKSLYPGLMLPAIDAARRPSTVLVMRGMCRVGDDLELIVDLQPPRQVKVLRLLERTGSFEQLVYADVSRD